MFLFNQDLLLVNHGMVLIYGVKSPVISYLLSAEAIRGLEIAWGISFSHIISGLILDLHRANERRRYKVTDCVQN